MGNISYDTAMSNSRLYVKPVISGWSVVRGTGVLNKNDLIF